MTLPGEVAVRERGVSIEVANGSINIYRPKYFGKSPVRAPIKDVAVINPFNRAENEETEQDSDHELTANTRVTYLNPPRTLDKEQVLPNLLVLFGERLVLPKVRPWTWVTTRGLLLHRPYKAMGRSVDGVFLRVTDPAAAIDALVAVGAEKTTRPGAWLRDHRTGAMN